MALTLVTAPTAEPVTIEQAKHHARIEVTTDDAILAGCILAARQWIEGQTHRALMTQTWDYSIDYDWPSRPRNGVRRHQIDLPINPVQSVSSVSYVDSNGATQTLASSQYTVAARRDRSYIVPAYDVTWPDVRCVPDAITVRFVAGYVFGSPEAADVPWELTHAVLLLAAHFYENREATDPRDLKGVPLGVEALISPFRC